MIVQKIPYLLRDHDVLDTQLDGLRFWVRVASQDQDRRMTNFHSV